MHISNMNYAKHLVVSDNQPFDYPIFVWKSCKCPLIVKCGLILQILSRNWHRFRHHYLQVYYFFLYWTLPKACRYSCSTSWAATISGSDRYRFTPHMPTIPSPFLRKYSLLKVSFLKRILYNWAHNISVYNNTKSIP